MIIVDQDAGVCRRLGKMGFHAVCTEGIEYLARFLKPPGSSDLIIPAIPIHVGFEWIKRSISASQQMKCLAVPDRVAVCLPNTSKGEGGELFISNADFICPDNCSEPDEVCTFTGRPRRRTLHRALSSLRYGEYQSIVIISRQLSPGVGGYESVDMFRALAKVELSTGPVLLSTACRCHGVMHAFSVEWTGEEYKK
jgi:hypothetical protein